MFLVKNILKRFVFLTRKDLNVHLTTFRKGIPIIYRYEYNMIHLVIYSSGKSLEITRRLRTNPHGNFKKSVEGVAIFLQIAMTLYGNKNLEEMRINSKIIIQRQNKEK